METTALTFASPVWFAALALLPALTGLFAWSQWRSGKLVTKVVSARLRGELTGAVSRVLRTTRAVLALAALTALIVALARPQKGYTERETTQRGRDIIIAVDTSRSMLATDAAPTRLARAKLFAKDLLQLAGGDRVGVVAFAGSAFLQAPLTLDRPATLAAIDELDTSIIPKGGTNIAEAVHMAQQAFGKGEGQTRALVIITDGEDLEEDAVAAAHQAHESGIRIFTVGIGSAEGSLIPITDERGRHDFVRDSAGKQVLSRLDANRLQEIAEVGGGFFEMLSPETAATIFERGILPLETAERGSMTSRQPIERYQWPLGIAMALLVLWMLLGERKWRYRRALAAGWVFFALSGVSAHAENGVSAYEAGDYDRALQEFQAGLKKSPGSAKLQFNAGAAAYKTGAYEDAVQMFSKALTDDIGDNDSGFRNSATYNLANALARRGEKESTTDKKKSDWKNAISHYETVLKDDPKNTNAKANQDIVKKLLEDLEKQEQQKQDQQNKDQQNKDQQNKDQQNKDQQNKDQQGKDQQGKDQQNKDQQGKGQQDKDQQDKDQQGKDQQGKDQQDKDQQNKNQQGKDQQGKDQQDKDQQDKDQQNKDQQNKNQQNKNQQNKDQQNKNQQNKDQQNKNQQNKDQQGENQPPQQKPSTPQQNQQPREAPAPTPGEKKEGEIKSANESDKSQPSAVVEPEEKEGEMSPGQARALLNSLRGDEDRVRLMQRAQEQTLKDW